MDFEFTTEHYGERVSICGDGTTGIELQCFDSDGDETSVTLTSGEATRLADVLNMTTGTTEALVKASDLSVNDALIRVAALHNLTVRFHYAKSDTAAIETRTFRPTSLKVLGDHTTFVGKDSDRSEQFRSFRTDRIKGTVAILGA